MAVQGEILLLPLVVLGMWRMRGDLRIRLAIVAWVITFLVMTIIFPEPGWRGGFFHSGAALQPLFWSMAPLGLAAFINWGKRVRGWDTRQASPVFIIGIMTMIILMTLFVVWKRVIGQDYKNPIWDERARVYAKLELALEYDGAVQENVVLVNNAPGYFAENRRPAISIPNGDVFVSLEVAHRYGARYLLLEKNHPQGLKNLYEKPIDLPGMNYLRHRWGTVCFRVRLFHP